MDKKSFLRGFGAGVLFCAIILGTSVMLRTSDSYVRSQARKLGMVEKSQNDESLFATQTPKASAAPTQTASAKDDTKDTKTESKTQTAASATPQASASTTKTSNKKQEKKMATEKKRLEKDLKAEEKKLTISDGEWSSDVSEALEKLGIIDDSKKFDKYLNQNGYSNSINSGTYSVSVDDTYEELAKKITGNQK